MAREADQGARQLEQPPDRRVVRVEARFAHALGQARAVVPPGERRGEALHLLEGEAERFSDVAHGAPRPVADHRGGERGALAPVLRVHVLDHLLAPLVLEIDVDVGRLVALPGHEALEQRVHPRRVHLGDAERVAHGRIRRRAPALAQNPLSAREAHHVVHGEEERLVAELGDERELVLDELANFLRRAGGKPPAQAVFGEPAQPARGRLARRHQLLGILVAQFVEREIAAPGDRERLGEELGRIQLREAHAQPQAALGVRMEVAPALRHGAPEPHRGEHVLQPPARAQVHVHVARRRQGQAGMLRDFPQTVQLRAVVRPAMQLRRDPGLPGEALRDPVRLTFVRRNQQDENVVAENRLEVVSAKRVSSLLRSAPAGGDQRGDRTVGAPVGREQHRLQVFPQQNFRPQNQFQAAFLGGDVRPRRSRERAFIRDRERRIAERRGARRQLLRVRSAPQEGEVGQAMQLRVLRQTGHAGTIPPPRGRSRRATNPRTGR